MGVVLEVNLDQLVNGVTLEKMAHPAFLDHLESRDLQGQGV